MVSTLIITGASGFLGRSLVELATSSLPGVSVVSIPSPRCGGIDLKQSHAFDELCRTVNVREPQEAVLIHAAALVDWDDPEALLANAGMAINTARWAISTGIGFNVLVSSVSVCSELIVGNSELPCQPSSYYGIGKWTAEKVWQFLIPQKQNAVVRLAGIWGWQREPTMFWNKLLQVAAQGPTTRSKPVVRRRQSYRNYVSVYEASECLLKIGINRIAGELTGAGRDAVDIQSYVEALQEMPGTKLSVEWQDDGGVDRMIYPPSAELLPCVKSFRQELKNMWERMPVDLG